jgi:hypothetical protein
MRCCTAVRSSVQSRPYLTGPLMPVPLRDAFTASVACALARKPRADKPRALQKMNRCGSPMAVADGLPGITDTESPQKIGVNPFVHE